VNANREGPLTAIAVVAVLALLLRWAYSGRRRDARMAAARRARDFGLLVPVSTSRDRVVAEQQRELLLGAGLRATLAPALGPEYGHPVRVSAQGDLLPRRAGVEGTHVLVFPEDVTKARELLSG
jgi:hypothetical protein